MADIHLEYYNAAYLTVLADRHVLRELSELFQFRAPNYQHHPKYKARAWDGIIRLLNLQTSLIYAGLFDQIVLTAAELGYSITWDAQFNQQEFSVVEAEQFIASLNIPSKFDRREYQIETFIHSVRLKRAVVESPTGSGKSFMIYLLARYYMPKRILIVVPTVTLVHQMASDFVDYGFNSDRYVNKIFAGQDKDTEAPITITTWQSSYDLDPEWFQQFEVIIGDEAHLFKAKSLLTIMGNLTECHYRFGFSGSLAESDSNLLVLGGLFGKKITSSTTKQLQDQGYLAPLKIKCINLKYSDSHREDVRANHKDYQSEFSYLCSNYERNRFIRNLTLSLKGNTLVLFRFVGKQGKELYTDIKKNTNKNVHFVHGKIDGEVREQIRKIVTNSKEEHIICASFQALGVGSNYPNLDNLVFASPAKGFERNIQAIGRILRPSPGKEWATLYDLSDDLTWKGKPNITLLHFYERIKIYNSEKHSYKMYNVQLNEDKTLI